MSETFHNDVSTEKNCNAMVIGQVPSMRTSRPDIAWNAPPALLSIQEDAIEQQQGNSEKPERTSKRGNYIVSTTLLHVTQSWRKTSSSTVVLSE